MRTESNNFPGTLVRDCAVVTGSGPQTIDRKSDPSETFLVTRSLLLARRWNALLLLHKSSKVPHVSSHMSYLPQSDQSPLG
jgi:hypothetical protein